MNPKFHLFLAEISLMWYQLTSFLSFQIKSLLSSFKSISKEEKRFYKNLNKSGHPNLTSSFNKYKKELLNSNEIIEVTDFGAGSRIFYSNFRPIHKIAKIAGISNKKAEMLISLCTSYTPKNILEIGTSLGSGTFALHLGANNSKITTLEGCPNTAEVAKQQLKKHLAKNVQVIVGEFEKNLPLLLNEKHFDFIYFDGNHSESATINYFEWAVKNSKQGDIYVIDDIHWSKEMNQAWKKIRKHPTVKTNITTYEWGLLIF